MQLKPATNLCRGIKWKQVQQKAGVFDVVAILNLRIPPERLLKVKKYWAVSVRNVPHSNF
tara:strand:- start:50 stop:229 length:180 start_codon:yes stop_codon:yes gene_type:complete